MEHQLKIYPLAEPVFHTRRPMAPEVRLALKEKDMYPFSEEGEELASLIGYPYKCFLRLLKEYSQIKMAEDDEEKTGFHTEEGVYCFTHMPKELKNSAATLQRMMEKVLADQRGRNVEIYLEEVVIKKQNKFIPKLAELKYPIREARMRFDTAKESGWTNEAEEALRRIKRKLSKLQTLAIPKDEEVLMLCLQKRNETISFVLLAEREGIQILVSYVSRPLQGMEICYTPTKKMVQALVHTTRTLRAIFRKQKVNVVTDGPMEEILKLSRREGRLARWVAEVRSCDISYILRKEAEGSVVKKFFGQGEQVEETPDANEGGTLNLSKKLQAKSTLTPRAWRLYLGKETIEEGSWSVLRKRCIRLAASTNQGKKDLHVFIDSLTLVAQVLNHTPLKNLEPKSRSVNSVGNYKAGILNHEVSVGIKTRPSVEETSNSKKGKATSNVPKAKPNYNCEASGSN
ncbi:reverse transcriptase domain-containing protein [Tanacetum coccineum]